MSSAIGRITHGCIGLYSDACEAALRRRGPLPAHRDRQARHSAFPCGPQGFSATAMGGRQGVTDRRRPLADDRPIGDAVRPGWHIPRAMTEDDMARVRDSFRRCGASARCASALTPSNCIWRTAICCTALCRRFRTRATTAGAARLKAACAFRSKLPARFALSFLAATAFGARLTGSDWLDGGLTAADAVVLAKALKEAGLDYVDVSSGGVSTQGQASVPTDPGYNVAIADADSARSRNRNARRRHDRKSGSRPKRSWPRSGRHGGAGARRSSTIHIGAGTRRKCLAVMSLTRRNTSAQPLRSGPERRCERESRPRRRPFRRRRWPTGLLSP